ncbi:MAG: Queuine tRNA-ribosyltransferase [Candidatus Yanofskybacteria bacterium GW2011_GWF1_44_227]|nr:MAG: Queuine tRNA-ribosyltransferase [Candidatus Yanofskybacteria bacterium GW2011_GWF1_44_227]
MDLQRKIGADIIFAFDHITSPHDNFAYNKKAVELTNKWAHICLKEHAKNQKDKKNKQALFGIVQGGIYPKLRQKSAKYIGSLPFEGFGIGGSYTKKQISEILKTPLGCW